MAVDIGGGSTEIISADRNQTYFSESYKLGAARLTQRFFRKGIVDKESIKELHNEVAGVLKPAYAKIADSGGFTKLIGTSGTVQALARIDREHAGHPHSDLHGWCISMERLEGMVAAIEKASLAGEKIRLVSQDRALTILAGSIVLIETLRALGASDVTFCSAALREGVVVDQLLQTGWLNCGLDSHRQPRLQSVLDLLKKYDGNFEHASHVANLSLALLQETKDVLHEYGERESNLLWSAAMLHDVGMFIGRNGHHKHSYYLIRHAGLLGYSEEELEIIANVARYHRGSEPKDSHQPFMSLRATARQLIVDLAAILRLGEAFDRSHRQLVAGLKAKLTNQSQGNFTRSLLIEPVLSTSENIDAELWAFIEKKQLFESQFKVNLNIATRAKLVRSVRS